MTTTTTLDEILRKRGHKKLRDEIDAVFAPVRRYLQVGYGLDMKHEGGKLVYTGTPGETIPMNRAALHCHDALKMVFEAILNHRAPDAEQKEVDDFIKNVGQLKDSVEELYDQIPR